MRTSPASLLLAALGALAASALPAGAGRAAEPSVPGSETIYRWVEELTALGVREPGSEASRRASQYVHDHFVESGLERVHYETAETLVWSASEHRLRVEGERIPSSPILHTFHEGEPTRFGTGEEGRRAELVYVGDGGGLAYWWEDVEGKIVVADVHFGRNPFWLYRPFLLGVQDSEGTFGWGYELVNPYSGGSFPESYYRAMRNGAVGFVGVLADYFDSHAYHNEAYDSYDEGRAMEIPGAWLSPVDGRKLIDRIRSAEAKGEALEATLRLEGELRTEQGRGVAGYLPGRTDEIILVESHHDSATPGATEDASGAAEVLALARHFAQVPKSERRRTLLFATMDTHFTDYALHERFARRHVLEGNPEGEEVVAVVTVEHIAKEVLPGEGRAPTRTGRLAPRALMVSNEVEGFEEIATSVMKEHRLDRTFAVSTWTLQNVVGTSGIPADSSDFLRAGAPVFAFVGSPLYLYDSIDTMDKVPKEELGRVAEAFAEVIHRIDALPSENFERLPVNLR